MATIIGNKVLFDGRQYNIVSENNGVLTAEAERDDLGFIPTIQGSIEQFSNLIAL